MRYRLVIEYDGAEFCGWQSQADRRAVQDALEESIKSFCGETVTVFGAGRTDSGVHARGQVAHIDLETEPQPDRVRDGINFHLRPSPVAVRAAYYARPDFDGVFGRRAIIAIASYRSARRWGWRAIRHGGCSNRSTLRPCAKLPAIC